MNKLVDMYFHTVGGLSSGQIPKSGIVPLKVKYICNFIGIAKYPSRRL